MNPKDWLFSYKKAAVWDVSEISVGVYVECDGSSKGHVIDGVDWIMLDCCVSDHLAKFQRRIIALQFFLHRGCQT